MIIDNLLHYREAQSASFGLSVAHKWLKNGILYLRWDTGAIIPDANLQASMISRSSYDDQVPCPEKLPRKHSGQVGDHPIEAVGIKPAHRRAPMMMLDSNPPELLLHTCHADRALDCVNDVSDGGPKSVTILGAPQQ